MISFVVSTTEPTRRTPMRSWFRPESATSIAVRLQPTNPWRVVDFQWEGDRLTLNSQGVNFVMSRVTADQQPDWLETRLADQHAKMDSTEKSGAPNGRMAPE